MATMNEKLCFVQLLHPGGEHTPDELGVKRWNEGDHQRKFMRSGGRFLDSSRRAKRGKIVFWGEWEPDSRVLSEVEEPVPEGPRFVYEPYLPDPVPEGWRQNTDPFVFGDSFHYTGCLQHARLRRHRTKKGPTQLRFLVHGSVVMFGSCIDRSKFVLDALLVVDRHIDHSRADYMSLRGLVSPSYFAATIDPWYTGKVPASQSHRLYFGAMFDAPHEGIFSFFPCLPAAEAPHGFARPEIDLAEVVTPTMTQNKRLNPQPDLMHVRELWEKVASSVEEQGLRLGVFADTPPTRRGPEGIAGRTEPREC
jgi:hypothetical protein